MMILRTRKEQYLNEIVGNGNTAPGTPYTREELFFADILGEVNAPAPVTRIEIYLAKIANKYSGEMPEPKTRIEKFIARAAGMDVIIPTPITREEMLWANYALIVEKELSGIPPLTFKAKKAGTLKNYRIYGQTVDGESVGDRTENLFDGELTDGYHLSDTTGLPIIFARRFATLQPITINQSEYCLTYNSTTDLRFMYSVFNNDTLIRRTAIVNNRYLQSGDAIDTTGGNKIYFAFYNNDYSHASTGMISNIMLNAGSTALPYEPYGYKIPVTLTADSAETTDIYLDEPLAKSGNNADYIDYATQKRRNSDGTESSVTLPEISTLSGTNTLTVGTEVQPSKVYLKGKIEEIPTRTVSYYSQDGSTLLGTETVESGGNASGLQDTPTKPDTEQYTYTFVGWSNTTNATTAMSGILNNITADKSVYAAFSETARTYTVYFYNGETLLETVTGVPSGGTATYTGAAPTSSQAGYIFSGWSPSNTNITADTSCYAQFKEDEMYESITDTWSQIIANVSNGTYSTKYHIGDTKKIDLGTEGEVIMTIVGIDTDDIADNSGKAPITWISKQLLKTNHRMNPTKRSGTSGTGALGGWEKAEMRSYLKETVKPLIPEVVRNAIKPVKKYSRIYNVSGSAVNNVLTTEDVWIPSHKEVFGSGLETLEPTYSTAFPDNASRIKSKAGSSAAWWWLRSAYSDGSFNIVHSDGSGNGCNASYTGGVVLGFCT